MRTSVDICIATFRRPALLDRLLCSIEKQDCLDDIRLRIMVIDNDKARSAEDTVTRHQQSAPFPITYDVEPCQNIALARNRALKHALADYVVFIDDDEHMEPNWLSEMLAASMKYDADVVFGPVLPELHPGAPEWCRRGGFFERKRFKTGTPRSHGGTGNTLVKTRFLKQYGLRFNPAYGLTGGSDTELFYRAAQSGAMMIWCDEAVVKESVSEERTTMRWLLRRAYRGGQVHARIFSGGGGAAGKLLFVSRRLGLLLIASSAAITAGLVRKEWRVMALQKVCSNAGQITGIMGGTYEEYRRDA